MTMYDMNYYWYWFVNIKEIGNHTRVQLIKKFGHPSIVYHSDEKDLSELLTAKQLLSLQKSKDYLQVESGLKKLKQQGIQFISWESPCYPPRLRNLYDPPFGFYVKGKLPTQNRPSAAIVGSRRATPYGKVMAEYFAAGLARQGVTVISGMAAGIDAHAHRGCLNEGGETLGILGGGIDTMYPKSNWNLYLDMYQYGGIFSEYNIGVANKAGLFPMRNRLISAMADVILIVEAGEKSGSLITADQGMEQGKEVYAVPGRITDRGSRGCNRLIAQGACVAESPEQIIADMKDHLFWKGRDDGKDEKGTEEERSPSSDIRWQEFTKEEEEVLQILDINEPKSFQYIMDKTDIPWKQLQHILCRLELKQFIYQVQQNLYLKKYL